MSGLTVMWAPVVTVVTETHTLNNGNQTQIYVHTCILNQSFSIPNYSQYNSHDLPQDIQTPASMWNYSYLSYSIRLKLL